MSLSSECRRLRESLKPEPDKPQPQVPVLTYRDAAPLLRRPFAPEAVRFKAAECWATEQGGSLSHAIAVPYIEVRTVFARLNMVCPDLWWEGEPAWIGGHLWATIHMRTERYGENVLTRRDIGDHEGKGRVSDAIKRAAVHFGVGESLYAVPPVELRRPTLEAGGLSTRYLRDWRQDGEQWLKLTPAGEQYCRDIYRRWLLNHGIRAFGRPIDHGNLTAEPETPITGPPMPTGRERKASPERSRQRSVPALARGIYAAGGESASTVPTTTEPTPEEVAQADLDALLERTEDGLHGERVAVNAAMLACDPNVPASVRLQAIEAAKDRRGLEALRTRLSNVPGPVQDEAPVEDGGRE